MCIILCIVCVYSVLTLYGVLYLYCSVHYIVYFMCIENVLYVHIIVYIAVFMVDVPKHKNMNICYNHGLVDASSMNFALYK